MTAPVPNLEVERKLLARTHSQILIAIDEVGRGALAGPLTVGAVAIDSQTTEAPAGVRDSKALTAKRRQELVPKVRQWAVACEVVDMAPDRIDAVGIVQALGEAAARAVQLVMASRRHMNAVVLLDGHHDFLTPIDSSYPVRTLVKGDATCASIAAASIVAKVHRDALMRDLHEEYPDYAWDRNVGYGTTGHRRALEQTGVSIHHRRSWRLLQEPTLHLDTEEGAVDV